MQRPSPTENKARKAILRNDPRLSFLIGMPTGKLEIKTGDY